MSTEVSIEFLVISHRRGKKTTTIENSRNRDKCCLNPANGGNHGLTISVNLINGRLNTQLLFGQNADMTLLRIDGDHNGCREDYEKAGFIKIQNGIITKSACIGSISS